MSERKFTTRVYLYGAVPLEPFPQEGIDALWENNALWNKLVELDKEKQADLERELCDADAEYRELCKREAGIEDALKKAFERKRNARMQAQTRSLRAQPVADASAEIARLKEERQRLWKDKKPARARARKAIDEKALNESFRKRERKAVRVDPERARRDANTSDEVSRNFKEARSRAFSNPRAALRFHRFDGTGYRFFRFRIRSPGRNADGVSPNELTQRGDADDRPFVLGPAKTRGRKICRELRVKVAGGARKAGKVYARFDLAMHRPLPEGAQINNAKLLRRRTGDRFKYSVAVSVRVPAAAPAAGAKGALGIDIGFRKQSDGAIRVAAIGYANGRLGEEIALPAKFVQTMEYVEALQSGLSDSAKKLGEQLKPLLKGGAVLPEEHRRYRMLRSVAMLPANRTMPFETAYKLADWFRNEPQTLPGEVLDLLLEWRRRGRAYREMHNLRKKTLARRKHLYREAAARLVAHGLPVGVEKLDLSRFAEVRDADNELPDKARSQRFLAAPSELLGAVRNAAEREGVPVFEVPAQYTSKTCSACGEVNDELGSEPKWACPACGVIHDRDWNAAINIAVRALKKTGKSGKQA